MVFEGCLEAKDIPTAAAGRQNCMMGYFPWVYLPTLIPSVSLKKSKTGAPFIVLEGMEIKDRPNSESPCHILLAKPSFPIIFFMTLPAVPGRSCTDNADNTFLTAEQLGKEEEEEDLIVNSLFPEPLHASITSFILAAASPPMGENQMGA